VEERTIEGERRWEDGRGKREVGVIAPWLLGG